MYGSARNTTRSVHVKNSGGNLGAKIPRVGKSRKVNANNWLSREKQNHSLEIPPVEKKKRGPDKASSRNKKKTKKKTNGGLTKKKKNKQPPQKKKRREKTKKNCWEKGYKKKLLCEKTTQEAGQCDRNSGRVHRG